MLYNAERDKRWIKAPNPADWYWSVRRNDGHWLTRPASEPDAAPGNSDPWSKTIPDVWQFDSEREAVAAAKSHGADDFTVHVAPWRGGQWIRGEGAYGGKPITDNDRRGLAPA